MNITHTTRQIQDGFNEATRQGPNNPANNISSSPQTKIGNQFGPIFDKTVLTLHRNK